MLRFYWPGNFILAGRTDEEITRTLDYYQNRGIEIERPDESRPIKDQEKVVVFHMLPAALLDQEFFYFEPVPDVGFQVHPNAIMDLRRQATNYENRLRGGLYNINPGRDISNLPPLDKLPDPRIKCCFFLPRDVMDKLAHFDWSQFTEEYIATGREREAILKHPNIKLRNTVLNTAMQIRRDAIKDN